MRNLAAFTILLLCCGEGAARELPAANKPSPATAAYEKRITAIASQAVLAEVSKHPERLNGVSMKLGYTVDARGRVHNVRVVSGKPERWVEKTAVRAIAAVEFPPIPKNALQDMGKDHIEAEAEVSYKVTWQPSAAEKVNSPAAGQPRTFIRVQLHLEPHSCVLAIAAIDGKSLPSPLKQVSLSPGRHRLAIRVWLGAADRSIVHADAPLAQSFKPHRYWIDGELSKSGLLRLVVEDEDERPPGVKHAQTK